ncbi:hypothetical protein F5B17DRAFT_417699 [Nemania serpens]|nr:hypothetical protein F5B17DRAFT_417699 [Nemania serpens]
MQVIATLLYILSLVEAGLIIKAPRTEKQGSPPSSGLVMFTLPPITNTMAASSLTLSTTTTTTTTTTATTTTMTTIPTPTAYAEGTATAIGNADIPETTAAPTLDLENLDDAGNGIKFVQTTFWACETFPLETHCGWHEPILDASNSGASRTGQQSVAARAGVAVACVVAALVYGL